jgi:protein O-mannosyl-transferase
VKGQKFIPLLVISAGLLAYHNSFTGAFVFDDILAIRENTSIRRLWPIWLPLSPPHRGGLTVEGRPLINLSLAVNYALGGYNMWGYHALNVTVHILAGLTLFGIVRRTLRQPILAGRFGAAADELAGATAVLWTVHPLQTESVTYIIQRAESVMGLFYFLTLYCFIRGAAALRSRPWYSLSVVACLLGMISKEVMFSAPLIVLLYDRALLSGSFREAWRRRRPLYLALASTWILLGLVTFTSQLPTTLANAQKAGLSRWVYLRTQPEVILQYLWLSVWPHPLSLDHAWPMARTWLSIVPPATVVVTLLAATAWALTVNSVWGLAGAWFFLILAPSSSIIPLHGAVYEHRMYLSLAAVLSLMVMGLYSVIGRRSLTVFALMAVALGVLTWRRNQDYRSEVALWRDAVAKFPNGPFAHYYLGVALGREGRTSEAIHQYELTLRIDPNMAEAHDNLGVALEKAGAIQNAIEHYQQALKVKPFDPQMQYNMGIALRRAGRIDEAIGHYEQAVRFDADFADAHYNLANALLQVNRIDEAIRHYKEALRIKPDYADAHQNLGRALFQAGRVQEAIGHYQQALQFDPHIAEAHYNWGLALSETGQRGEAIEHYEQAVRINPGFAEAHYVLGVALWQGGQLEDAIRHYEETLRLKPDYAEAQNNWGIALMQQGRVTDAMEHYEQALRIKPDLAEAHFNLGAALEKLERPSEAIGHYQEALRIRPDFAGAQAALARLQAVR